MPDSTPRHDASAPLSIPPALETPVRWIATVLLAVTGIVGTAIWWAGRGLPEAPAEAWLRGWASTGNIPAVALAVPTATFMALAVGVALWRGRAGGAHAIQRSVAHLGGLALLPLTLLIHGPLDRLIFASGLIALIPWISLRSTTAATVVPPIPQAPAFVRRNAHWIVALACALFLGTVAQGRHAAHWTSLIDLGLFYEQFDNPEGKLLYAPTIGMSFLGEHFSPILVLLTPLMKLFPSPLTLLWIQAFAIAAGGLMLRRLAVDRTGDTTFGLILIVAWCLNPWVQQAAYYDFHMDLLESPMLFGACWAAMTKRDRTMWLCAIGLWITKEDTFIYTSAIAVWLALTPGRRTVGAALFVVGLVQAAVLLAVVLPAIRPDFDPAYFSTTGATESYAFLGRYDHLGSTPQEILGTLISNPFYLAAHVFSGDRVSRVASLVIGFGGLALAGRWRWLWLLPTGEILLSNPGRMSNFSFYYGVVILPFAAIAAVEGYRTLSPGRRRAGLVSLSLAVGFACLTHTASWLAPETQYQDYAPSARHERVDAAIAQIPADVRVAATGYLAVRLQRNRAVTMIPFGVDEAEWFVLDLQRPPWPTRVDRAQRQATDLLASGHWSVEADDVLFLLMKHHPNRLPEEEIAAHTARWDALQRTFTLQAELTENTRYRGRFEADQEASNGRYLRIAAQDSRGEGHAFWGPYINISPGDYTVGFRLRWVPGARRARSEDRVATIDVFCGGQVVAERHLTPGDLSENWATYDVQAPFPRRGNRCESRVYYYDRGGLDVDAITWTVAE